MINLSYFFIATSAITGVTIAYALFSLIFKQKRDFVSKIAILHRNAFFPPSAVGYSKIRRESYL